MVPPLSEFAPRRLASRQHRGAHVTAVLTIIQAWRKAGCPRSEVSSIETFGGSWSDYCRQPLIWLGHPDPATGLLEQISQDPDAEALLGLMTEWRKEFGSVPTTIRAAVETAHHNNDLFDAMREFPVEERGAINRNKLGWILRKNANRIVGGFEFREAKAADGRKAWRVVPVGAPLSPVSPPSIAASQESLDEMDDDF